MSTTPPTKRTKANSPNSEDIGRGIMAGSTFPLARLWASQRKGNLSPQSRRRACQADHGILLTNKLELQHQIEALEQSFNSTKQKLEGAKEKLADEFEDQQGWESAIALQEAQMKLAMVPYEQEILGFRRKIIASIARTTENGKEQALLSDQKLVQIRELELLNRDLQSINDQLARTKGEIDELTEREPIQVGEEPNFQKDLVTTCRTFAENFAASHANPPPAPGTRITRKTLATLHDKDLKILYNKISHGRFLSNEDFDPKVSFYNEVKTRHWATRKGMMKDAESWDSENLVRIIGTCLDIPLE